jgi:iron complex transport system ATP-binding protein
MLDVQYLECRVKDKNILSIDTISFESGELSAVIGTNGAGKSTLLKAISDGMYSSGDIRFHDKELSLWPSLERARHLAVLPQNSQLNFPFKAGEVVALGLTPLSMTQKDARTQIKTEMTRTDCYHLFDKSYPQLSGGEKQRVQLARVLLQLCQATKPPLLLLDEPTSAQDLGQQHSLLKLIKNLCEEQGYAALAILHDLNHVMAYSHQCIVLHGGRLMERGSPLECLTEQSIAEYWGYQAKLVKHQGQNVII